MWLDRNAVSPTILSERYRLEKSIISDIKKERETILSFQQKVNEWNTKVKIIMLVEDMKHDFLRSTRARSGGK